MPEVELDWTDDWDDGTDWERVAQDAVNAAFSAQDFAPAMRVSISINLSDNDEVQALNAQWRGKDKPTNVLSFPMLDEAELAALIPPRNGEGDRRPERSRRAGVEGHRPSHLRSKAQEILPVPLHHPSDGPPPPLGEVLLGDIILAQTVCAAEAEEKQIPLPQHVTHLIIHGTLHLLGLDHIEDEQAEHMEALEVKALASLGIANPY